MIIYLFFQYKLGRDLVKHTVLANTLDKTFVILGIIR